MAEGQREEDRCHDKSEAVIEIEELEVPGRVDLLGVGPASPTEHAEHHQKESHRIRGWCKQLASGSDPLCTLNVFLRVFSEEVKKGWASSN